MAIDTGRELEGFHRFIRDKLSAGATDMMPEEVLDEWRVLHPASEELAESVAAIRAAVADMRGGDRGRPFEAVLAEIRQQLGGAT